MATRAPKPKTTAEVPAVQEPVMAPPLPSDIAEVAALPPPALTLIVTGPQSGRRRAGRAFGPEPVTLNAMDLTQDEIAALQADPALTVQILAAPY
jgi:hypothetical protein